MQEVVNEPIGTGETTSFWPTTSALIGRMAIVEGLKV